MSNITGTLTLEDTTPAGFKRLTLGEGYYFERIRYLPFSFFFAKLASLDNNHMKNIVGEVLYYKVQTLGKFLHRKVQCLY